MKHKSTVQAVRYMTGAAVIAALYAALTLVAAPTSFGAIQFRISEALTVLPLFMPEAVPGLFIGCIVANLFSPVSAVWDVIIGSTATIIAALITYKIRIKWLVPLPAVLVNALIIGAMLAVIYGGEGTFAVQFAIQALSVGAGQALACYGLGIPLILVLERVHFFSARKQNKSK